MKMNQAGQQAVQMLSKVLKNSTGQLLLGAAAGYVAGRSTMHIGKPLAFGAGFGLLAFQAANYNGLVKDDFIKTTSDKTKSLKEQYSQKVPKIISNIKTFARSNRPLSIGFVGGVLLAIAS